MHIGKNIKYHRIKQGMTQEELALGILSVSYLSKIENNQIIANPDIVEELYLRLGITEIQHDEDLILNIKSWYQIIIDRNLPKSREMYDELAEKITTNNSFEVNSLFNLISIRFFLTFGDIEQAEKLLTELSSVHKNFSNEFLFYYYKFKGNLEYLKNDYNKSYLSYKYAKSIMPIIIQPFERGDIFYSLGLTISQLFKPYLAIDYAHQALDIFRGIYCLDRSSDCHLLLALEYQRIQDYSEAKSHYHWASKLAREVGYCSLYGIIEHNLGYFFYVQEDFINALHHYQNSLKLKSKGNIISKLTTIIYIIKIFYKQKDDDQLAYWCAHAEEFSNNLFKDHPLKYELEIFRYLNSKEYDAFEFFTRKTAIPYFKKNGLYHLATYYSEVLALYFKENRKYKLASLYFEFSNELLKKKSLYYK